MKLIESKAEFQSDWEWAKRAALRTIGLRPKTPQPTDEWKARMLLAEHSPIRNVIYYISITNIRQWVTVHLIRHWLGFIPFIHTQRSDRRCLEVPRDELPQGSLNDMDISVNAQALINVSRKRLCNCASKETREAWQKVKDSIKAIDPVMASKMVPECIYRGFCPEFMNPCGYANTEKYQQDLKRYRSTDYDESGYLISNN